MAWYCRTTLALASSVKVFVAGSHRSAAKTALLRLMRPSRLVHAASGEDRPVGEEGHVVLAPSVEHRGCGVTCRPPDRVSMMLADAYGMLMPPTLCEPPPETIVSPGP